MKRKAASEKRKIAAGLKTVSAPYRNPIMRLEFFIALRHLLSREKRKSISIITFICILGVIIGVAALIAVNAVMDGAQTDYFQKLIDQYSHLQVYEWNLWTGETTPVQDYEALRRLIEEDPEVVAASPVIKRYALMLKYEKGGGLDDSARSYQPGLLFGVDPLLEEKVSRLLPTDSDDKKPDPFFSMHDDPYGQHAPRLIGKKIPGDGEIVVGRGLARTLRVNLGDTIMAVTKVAETATARVAKTPRLKVVGIFKSGLFDVDQGAAYVSLASAQDMYLMGDEVDYLHARITDPYRAEAVRKRVLDRLAGASRVPYGLRTWGELAPDFFVALKMEKIVMFVILLLIVIVAALNIVSILIMVTLEKTRQIGILRAMGTSRRSIARIFLIQGGLISFFGTGFGVILGLLLCWGLKTLVPASWVPAAVYGLDGLPVLVKPLTVFIIAGCSVGICLIASLLPALGAARLDIVEALRHE